MIKVLISEDDIYYATLLMNSINEINNNVRVIGIAQNGLETIQKIADNEIDIILLDLIDKKPNIKTIINTIINKIEMKGG